MSFNLGYFGYIDFVCKSLVNTLQCNFSKFLFILTSRKMRYSNIKKCKQIFISFETVYILKNSQSQYKKKMIDSLRRRYARRALHFFVCGDVTKNSPRILHEFAANFSSRGD